MLDLSKQQTVFEAFIEGDIITLIIDGIKETYPAQTSAKEVVWIGSKNEPDTKSPNYSIASITQEGDANTLAVK